MAHKLPEELEVRQIRFSKDVLLETFENGKKLTDVLSDIQTGLLDLETLPLMTVVKKNKLYFSLNNRRLWVLKQYAKFLEEKRSEILRVPVKHENAQRFDRTLLTTTSEGKYVKVQNKEPTETSENIKTVMLSEIHFSCYGIYEKRRKIDYGNFLEPYDLPIVNVVKRNEKLYALDNNELLIVQNWCRSYLSRSQAKKQTDISKGNIQTTTSNVNTDIGAACSLDANADKFKKGSKGDKSCDATDRMHIKVRLMPYHTLPDFFNTFDEGISIGIRNKEPKHKKTII